MSDQISYLPYSIRVRVIIEGWKEALRFAADVIDPCVSPLRDRIAFFTDGSFNEVSTMGGAGVAFMGLPGESPRWTHDQRGVVGAGSSRITELVGLSMALQHANSEMENNRRVVSKHKNPYPDIYILTDCKSALDTLSDYLSSPPGRYWRWPESFSHPIFEDISYRLDLLVRFKTRIEFCWVPGHAGSSGNIRADDLAKTARLWLDDRISIYGTNGPFGVYRLPYTQSGKQETKKRKAEGMGPDQDGPRAVPTSRLVGVL